MTTAFGIKPAACCRFMPGYIEDGSGQVISQAHRFCAYCSGLWEGLVIT